MDKRYENIDNSTENQSYLRAKKKTQEIKKFYKHLVIYIVVNIIISYFKVTRYMGDDGFTFEEALFQIDTFVVWIIWGFFLLLRAIRTFKADVFLGSDWEERKIKEIMDENKR